MERGGGGHGGDGAGLRYRGLDRVVGLDREVEDGLGVGRQLVRVDRHVTVDPGHRGHRELDVVDEVREVVLHDDGRLLPGHCVSNCGFTDVERLMECL